MPPVQLTEGAIPAMLNTDSKDPEFQPVVQVRDIRPVKSQNQSGDRFRILISDGSFSEQGMLATQLNTLVKSGQLLKGSIVQLTQFVCNVIQNRKIIIIIGLDVIVGNCELIGEPRSYGTYTDGNIPSNVAPCAPGRLKNQPAASSGACSNVDGAVIGASGGNRHPESCKYGSSNASNMESGRFNSGITAQSSFKPEYGSGVSRAPMNNYAQPPPIFANRGPIATHDMPPRIVPIAALNPYQGRWTIKARVTTKGELRHYNNPRGDGKVFSFDLLDSDGGEIRVTCFNAVAEEFYHQIEPGRLYMISKGTLKPAQKNFNHLRNDHEIFLDNTSIVQPCSDDDRSIPQQRFHFRPISDIEVMENNDVVDVIGIVSSISPSSSIMRKNGTETLKRTLQLKDMSGRSVELTLWGNFANAEGQILQNSCDTGVSPILAVKSARVNDFNGKSVGTISTSQLFIDPDFIDDALKLRTWFNNDGKSTRTVSISREMNVVRSDVRRTISQIKDEKLGMSEKPDFITVSATLTYIKMDNFCYTACPLKIGDRQCNKKVMSNGDGKWSCDRCNQMIDECDYRYILQMQIQDHTGITWVTAFQECGEEIMGMPAKQLYIIKHEEQDEEKQAEILCNVLFTKFLFKLKVKEERFGDDERVKSTVLKAEKVNFQMEPRHLLAEIAKWKETRIENVISGSGLNAGSFGSRSGTSAGPASNYISTNSNLKREPGLSNLSSNGFSGMYMNCSSCGGTGHNSVRCLSLVNGPGQSYNSNFGSSRVSSGSSFTGGSNACFKCHQTGHFARDCPGANNIPPAHGNSSATPGKYGMVRNQHVGGF